ncbi:MAG: ribosomal protein S18-alanine N-acetyltransferase [Mariprofundaceae bacterium]|nr:ribosomal protein S18-alanine N-acetyltransferase [Mariprofundaceae bacterium]
MSLIFRQGCEDDLTAVYKLNCEVFPESWSNDGLKAALKKDYELLLCMDRDLLAGYLLSRSVLDEVHIMQIAVAPSHQRRGIAGQLSRMLLNANPGRIFLLEVRVSNVAAQALYAKLGFARSGYRKAYYVAENKNGAREDAVLMSCQNSL